MSGRILGLGQSFRNAMLASRALQSNAVVRNAVLKRGLRIQTESFPASAQPAILNKQRLNRPSSPHFTIYQPQLTWVGSIVHRFSGAGLSALLYGFSIAYLFAPGVFDSGHVVEFVHGLPDAFKYACKGILAAPFAFHVFNGLRHLSWDVGYFLTLKGAYRSGYAVLGATAVSTVALLFM